MTQSRQSSNLLVRLLGSAALVGLVGIVALGWSIYSSQSQEKAMERQLSNQATQIAKQDIQIALNAEQNRLLSGEATAAAKKASIEDQLRTPRPTDRADFAPTATALAFQSAQVEATRQAIEVRQKQIEATQTAIARPPAPANAVSPIREQKRASIGTGVFAQATYSDGNATIDENSISQHLDIQRIWPNSNPDGCAVAQFDTDRLWIGSARRAAVTVNETVIGEVLSATGKHGYIVNFQIHRGDRICIAPPDTVYGFHIVFGPDLYYHYDSYCYRGNC